MKDEIPSYYAIIPANVRYCEKINANEKLLYGEISCLTNKTGKCWASNSFFSKLYKVTNKSISLWINNLKREGLIKVELINKPNSKEIDKRIIYLTMTPINPTVDTPMNPRVHTPMNKKVVTPMNVKVQGNNTRVNNTSNKGEDKSSVVSKANEEKQTLESYDNIKLTQTEYNKLEERFNDNELDQIFKKLSNYKHSKNKTYKSDYQAIWNWVITAVEKSQ